MFFNDPLYDSANKTDFNFSNSAAASRVSAITDTTTLVTLGTVATIKQYTAPYQGIGISVNTVEFGGVGSTWTKMVGTSGAGSLFQLDPFGGAYMQAGNSSAAIFTTNTVERARITSDGLVGIGTSTPSYALDVNGNARVNINGSVSTTNYEYGAGYDSLTIQSTIAPYSGGISSIAFTNTGMPMGRIYCQDAQPTSGNAYLSRMVFQTNASGTGVALAERMRIDANGYVGIGCNAPAYTLDVAGTIGCGAITSTGQLKITEATGTSTVPTTANTQPTATSTPPGSGMIGSLTLVHTNAPGQSSLVFPSATNASSDYAYITYMDDVSNATGQERSRLLIGADNDPTNPANLDGVILQPFGGYVGIGQMNPVTTLDVNGNQQVKSNGSSSTSAYGTTNDTLTLRSTCNAYGGGIASIFFGNSAPASNYPFARIYAEDAQPTGGAAYASRLVFQTNNRDTTLVERMRIEASGNVGIGTNAPVTTLDVNGGLTVRNGFRPSYSNITSGTSITASSTYGTHYDIQTSAITGLTISYPLSSGTASTNWSNDSNGYWIFRNNTGTYLSLAITYTTAPANIYPTSMTIPPGNSVTLMATYPGGGTNSNYVLF